MQKNHPGVKDERDGDIVRAREGAVNAADGGPIGDPFRFDVFDFEGLPYLLHDGEPLFHSLVVGDVLSKAPSSIADELARHDRYREGTHYRKFVGEELAILKGLPQLTVKSTVSPWAAKNARHATLVTRRGFEKLAMRANSLKADEFVERLGDVLDQMRATGVVVHPDAAPAVPGNLFVELASDPDAILKLVDAVHAQALHAKSLEATIEAQAPKAEAWERVEKSEDEYLVREATKLLRPTTGVTERALVGALIANGWAQRLKKRLQATEKGMRRGVVVSRIHTWRDPVTGDQRSTPQLFVSGKGLRVLGEMFDLTRDDVLPRPERRH